MLAKLLLFAQETVNTSPLPHPATDHGEIQKALDIVFTITGALALLIVTVAGFRYILSRGDPQATAQAKNAIIYALVGLSVSIAAFTIVNFVVRST
jgi:hypothetical protein